MAIFRGSGSASSTSDQATIDEVTQQATNAANSATSAASSASSAASSASSASSSASTATTKASEASTSATNAAISEFNASAFAASASTSNANAGASATTALSAETAATTAKTAAEAAQVAAESAQTAAETAETGAASSASTASTAATTATTKASEASASATTASSAATAAESARDSTLAAFDSFDDRYLGSKTADPTLDNDGNALVGGALYFNSVDEVMKVYTGSQWVAAYADVSGALLAVNNLSDLNNATSARTNLGLGTAATTASTDYATAAQGTLADSAVQPGDLATVATTGAYSDLTGSPTAVSSFTNDSGYITDYTVTQGDVTAHQAALSITESQISDLQSYLTSIPDNYILNTGDAITGDLTFGDNNKAVFGAGSDLQIYHDPVNGSFISDTGSGNLRLRGASYVILESDTGETYAQGEKDGAFYVYHNNAQKLATTSTGIDVTGTVTADGLTVDGTAPVAKISATGGGTAELNLHRVADDDIYTDWKIRNEGGPFRIRKDNTSQNDYLMIQADTDVKLYYDNAEKFTTASAGVAVTGRATGTLTTDNDLSFDMNASNYFKCTPTGNGTLTFTNITAGQSGNIWLDNSGGHTISAASSTYIASADLTTISTAGVYFLSYYSDGTNVMVSATPAVTSAGA